MPSCCLAAASGACQCHPVDLARSDRARTDSPPTPALQMWSSRPGLPLSRGQAWTTGAATYPDRPSCVARMWHGIGGPCDQDPGLLVTIKTTRYRTTAITTVVMIRNQGAQLCSNHALVRAPRSWATHPPRDEGSCWGAPGARVDTSCVSSRDFDRLPWSRDVSPLAGEFERGPSATRAPFAFPVATEEAHNSGCHPGHGVPDPRTPFRGSSVFAGRRVKPRAARRVAHILGNRACGVLTPSTALPPEMGECRRTGEARSGALSNFLIPTVTAGR